MNTNNIKIIAAAAVVIALCLVFSYFYIDGGDEVRDPSVGDIYQYEATSVDAEGNIIEYTITETIIMDAEGQLTMYRSYDDGSMEYRVSETYNGIPGDATVTGSETIGGYACDIYTYTVEDDHGTTVSAWVDQDGVMRQVVEVGGGTTVTSVLVSTTVGEPLREFGSSQVDSRVAPGSYLAFEFQQSDESVPVTMLVEHVGDGTVTYRNSWTDEVVTVPTGSFASGGEWGDSTGTALVSTPYGERLCSIHSESRDGITETVFLGVDDHVCYYYSIVESDGSIYGGLLMSSTQVWSDDAPRAMTVGDYYVQQTTVTYPDGSEDQYSSSGIVTAVDGPFLRIDVVDDDTEGIITYEYPYFRMPAGFEYQGMELMDNGQFEGELCDVWSATSGDLDVTYWITGAGMLVRTIVETDGTTSATDLLVSSQSEPVQESGSSTVDRIPGLGDFYIFESQLYGLFEMRITDESDGTVTYTCSIDGSQGTCTAEEFVSTGQFEGIQMAGVHLVSNPVYGDRACVQYIMAGDDPQVIYVGADDGVCYRVETEDDVWTLMGSSFVYGDLEMEQSPELSEGDVILLESDTVFDVGGEAYSLMKVEVLSIVDGAYTLRISYDGEVSEVIELDGIDVIVGEPLEGAEYLCAYGKIPCTVSTATVNGEDAVVMVGDGVVFGVSYIYDGFTIGFTVIAATFLNDTTSL